MTQDQQHPLQPSTIIRNPLPSPPPSPSPSPSSSQHHHQHPLYDPTKAINDTIAIDLEITSLEPNRKKLRSTSIPIHNSTTTAPTPLITPTSANLRPTSIGRLGINDRRNTGTEYDLMTHKKPLNYDDNHWTRILSHNDHQDNSSHDPLLLKDRLQDELTLSKLRQRGWKSSPVQNFYHVQNQHINNLLRSLDEDAKEAKEINESIATQVKLAIRGSFLINCLLAVLQLYAAISSLSLSFFATALDAIFDPCANLALNYAHKYAKKVDLTKYPSGGSRFETIGNIIYSGAMGCASMILVVESIEVLIKGITSDSPEPSLHLPAIIAVSTSFLAKFVLFLFCWTIRNQDSQVRVLWEDHRNDLFINAFGIFTNAAGVKIKWWIDPLGGMLISIGLIILWGVSISREFKQLAGVSAPVDFMQRVVYKAMTFSSHIEKIDSCKCYHVGPNYFVEIDIVMDGNTPLWLAHDLGQELQDKLETLPNVDRAFVHLDHEVDHKPEHARHK